MHRCSVLGILHKYKVHIPQPVSQLLTKCPGKFEKFLLGCIRYEGSEEDAEFHSFQMKDLTKLHKELQQFLTQIGNAHLVDFMVHFSMYNSQIFAQYLKRTMVMQQSSSTKERGGPSLLESLEMFTPVSEATTAKLSGDTRCSTQVSSVCTQVSSVCVFNGSHHPCKSVYSIYIQCIQSVEYRLFALSHMCGGCTQSQIYHDALQDTEAFLKSIVLGEATYRSLCTLDCLQGGCRAVDVDRELSILQTFHFPGTDRCKDIDGMKSILQLIQFADYIDNIYTVCNKYQITGCLQDAGMSRLLEICSVLVSEERMELNAISSRKYLEEIREILDLPEMTWHGLRIFAAVKDSAEFHQFLKEKRFLGVEGASFFKQQHTLITAHLQHEEYNEKVLNHLLAAFHYISPFLDTEQNLQQLVNEVYLSCRQAAKDSSTDFVQLDTVNNNINLVRLWFSGVEVSAAKLVLRAAGRG